jgi:hypothetical protein
MKFFQTFERTWTPIMRASPSWPNHFPKVKPSTRITQYVRISTYAFWWCRDFGIVKYIFGPQPHSWYSTSNILGIFKVINIICMLRIEWQLAILKEHLAGYQKDQGTIRVLKRFISFLQTSELLKVKLIMNSHSLINCAFIKKYPWKPKGKGLDSFWIWEQWEVSGM